MGQQRERSTSEDEVGDGSIHLSSGKISRGLMSDTDQQALGAVARSGAGPGGRAGSAARPWWIPTVEPLGAFQG